MVSSFFIDLKIQFPLSPHGRPKNLDICRPDVPHRKQRPFRHVDPNNFVCDSFFWFSIVLDFIFFNKSFIGTINLCWSRFPFRFTWHVVVLLGDKETQMKGLAFGFVLLNLVVIHVTKLILSRLQSFVKLRFRFFDKTTWMVWCTMCISSPPAVLHHSTPKARTHAVNNDIKIHNSNPYQPAGLHRSLLRLTHDP